jgi:hypothetical protein
MLPKALLKSATTEDRIFIRKWTYGVAAVYGALALALLLVGLWTAGSKNVIEASRAPPDGAARGFIMTTDVHRGR